MGVVIEARRFSLPPVGGWMHITAAEALRAGYIGQLDALVQIRELQGDPHSGAGGRAFAFTLAGGLSFEVLPERGLDVGAVWYAGQPVAWRSALGSPGLAPSPSEWLGRFGGGLLVTCGLDNIGSPRGGYGQHGSHHDTRAYDVAIRRVVGGDGAPGVAISGTIDSVEVFGRRIRLHRTITSYADTAALTVSDRIVNEGAWPAPVAVLYHLNFGAPLVLPGTTMELRAATSEPREPTAGASWQAFPEPTGEIGEQVWRHSGLEAVDGIATARVGSPNGLGAEVRWGVDALPDLMQWVFPTRGSWALGVEPCNAPLWGPERESETAGIQTLAPGEVLETEVIVEFFGQAG